MLKWFKERKRLKKEKARQRVINTYKKVEFEGDIYYTKVIWDCCDFGSWQEVMIHGSHGNHLKTYTYAPDEFTEIELTKKAIRSYFDEKNHRNKIRCGHEEYKGWDGNVY